MSLLRLISKGSNLVVLFASLHCLIVSVTLKSVLAVADRRKASRKSTVASLGNFARQILKLLTNHGFMAQQSLNNSLSKLHEQISLRNYFKVTT
ncbi:hypothetical protein YC2023_118617 [Brassica napus]